MTQTARSDTRDIARGAAVNFVGVLARTSNVLFFIVLGRLYGVEITGMFILTRATMDVLSKLGILGLDRGILTLASRYHAEGREDDVYRVIGQALFIGSCASLIIFSLIQLGARPLAADLFKDPALELPFRIAGFAVILLTFSAILLFSTRALRIMRYEVLTKSMLEPLTLLILGVVFWFLDGGIVGLCFALLIALALGVLLSAHLFSKVYSLRRVLSHFFESHQRGALFRYSTPIGFYDLLNLLLQRMDLFLVGRFLPTANVGVYGVAQEVASPLKSSRQAFDPIFIPVVSASYQLKDKSGMLRQYRNVTRWVLLINAALLGFMVLAAEPVMNLFGSSFGPGATAAYLLAAGLMINGVAGVAELFLLIDRPLINLANTVGTILVNGLLCLLLIPAFGIYGGALAMLGAMTAMNAARLLEVRYLYRLQPFGLYHGKALLAFLLSLGGMLGVRELLSHSLLTDLACGLAFLPLYFLLLRTFGLAPEEQVALKKIAARIPWRRQVM
jgi:O-antigen/teichoic acid export membrane protein